MANTSALDLRRAVAARDFYEDGASSILPNSFVPRHRTKPSRALEEALEHRRKKKAIRAVELQSAREQSALIEQNHSPERVLHNLRHENDERDEEIMVSKFMRGEHWIFNPADAEFKAIDREESLYAESIKVIQESQVMQQDFEMQHIGKVQYPVETQEEKVDRERQSDYIHKINNRIGLFDTYRDLLREVSRLQDCVNEQEGESSALIKEVELGRVRADFQWQMERNNRVKVLRAKTAVDLEDLDHAKTRMSSIRREISIKYPEMASGLFEEEASSSDMIEEEDEDQDQPLKDTGKSVFCWIIGRLTSDGKICCILFGQFCRDVQPPSDDWIFVGQNIDRNLVTTETLSDEQISAAQKLALEDGVSSTAESDHVLTDADMLVARQDVITVSPVTVNDDSYKASVGLIQTEHLTYKMSGCSIYNLNGKYTESGTACHVPKYRNLRGWSIYRVALLEIPELGILAENCYSALKGPSISVMLDKKSNKAFAELVDKVKEIKEGTVHFKRRFAEMSRAGQRIINTDQTSQLYRNEELRAQARSESDRMLMMILQAVSSKPGQGGSHGDSPKSRSGSPAQLLSVAEEDEAEIEGSSIASTHDSPVTAASSPMSFKSKSSKFTHKSKTRARSSPGSVKTAASDSTDAMFKNFGVLSGVDLDIKVTLSKSLNYQVGSQGFPLQRRSTFLAEEAELTSLVTKFIEAREEEIFKLRIESEKVSRVYLESHVLIKDMDIDSICADLFLQMRKVREATLLTSEALGAWARLCYKEKKNAKQRSVTDSEVDPKSARTYCVTIAFKGSEIYPQSNEMKSQTARWSRSLEKAKVATNTKYIGEFKTVEAALNAFGEAMSKLLPEQLLEEDFQGAKPIVGLRSCGKHFAVRSNAVPNDLPCECCRAQLLAQPDLVVPSALQDPEENLQQFIWRGVNYLEKIWTDVDFLDENILLKKAFPEFEIKFNPLLLLSRDFQDVLEVVSVQDGKVLEYLKGRQEQVRDAQRSGTIVSKVFTDRELMGLPFRTRSNQLVDLDREADSIEADKAAQNTLIQTLQGKLPMGSGLGGITSGSGVFGQSVRSEFPPRPASSSSKTEGSLAAYGTGGVVALPRSSSSEARLLPFTPWSTLSPKAALDSPDIIGRLFAESGNAVSFAMTEYGRKALAVLQEDPLDYVGKNRLMRSFHILGQSATLTKHKLPQTAVPDRLKESVLKRKKILRSTSNPVLPSANADHQGPAVIDIPGHGTHADDLLKTIPTEVGYFFRGASFAVPQMRPPPAHRIDDVWCRSDAGEWKGMNKGRAMRSFEFGEKIRIEGINKNEERRRMQMMIRRIIERDIVLTNVEELKGIIARSKEIRGSVLALDVIQAEQFLKYRGVLIKNIRKMQKLARGNASRRRVSRIRAQLQSAATRAKTMYLRASSMARELAQQYISGGLAHAVRTLTSLRFRVSVNFSGVLLVLTIRGNARSAKRGFALCPACCRQDIVKVYDRSKKAYRSEPAMCTCRWWHGEETWRVQLFDPLTRNTRELTLTLSQVRENIDSIERAKALMDPKFRNKALVGASFDRLRALFDASFVTFDGQLAHSNSFARRRAADESSLLPLLPRIVTDELLEAVYRREDGNLASDKILPYGNMRHTSGPLTVTNIDKIEKSKVLRQWEPFADYEYAHRHVKNVEHHVSILQERIRLTQLDLAAKEKQSLSHECAQSEWDRMAYEDARMAFIRIDENIKAAGEKIERVMKYQKDTIAAFELEERNEKQDWKQSYDDKEDGNAWEGLNNRRKFLAKYEETLERFLACARTIPHIDTQRAALQVAVQEARKKASIAVDEAKGYAPTLEKVRSVLGDVVKITKSSVRYALAPLAMPRKRKWPNHRRVQKARYMNVFIRDPFVRARKENIGLWSLLERSVMALRPLLKSFTGKAVLRSIVEIYQDPVTHWVLVRINQDEKPVEESSQHLDMHVSKLELSDMTNSALDTDILLRPQDVKVILSKAPNWPALHIKKEPFVFRAIDVFVKAEMQRKAEEAAAAAAPAAVATPDSSEIKSTASPRSLESSSLKQRNVAAETNSAVAEWIPPSKRLRSVDYVKVFPTKGEKYKSKAKTFAARQKHNELSEVETARSLMTYLRLHPYTGRPCMGLVHFVRRQKYCVERVTKSRWYRDLAKGMPSTWNNEIVGDLRRVGRRILKISTRSCLDHFELRLKSVTSEASVTILIPFQDMIENLATNQPILLASLLCETVTNRFSDELHNFILDYVDFQLPGEEHRRFWRKSLLGGVPRLEFQVVKASRYRGAIYKTHRFFSGAYFEARFSVSANADLRIELGPPTDGNFWGHKYSGQVIVVDISRDELRAFVAKIAMLDSIVPPQYFGNIRLLHPNHWIELFPLLLDLIILPEKKAAVEVSDALPDEIEVKVSREEIQLKEICAKVRYVVDKFNAWALKTKGQSQPLTATVIDKVESHISSLQTAEPWSLQFYKDEASRKLVEVRSEIWSSHDVDRFIGEDERTFKSRDLQEMTLSQRGAAATQSFNTNKSFLVGTSGHAENSYWSVRLLTDEGKARYFMDVAVVDDFNAGAQRLLGGEEAELMASEEKRSRLFAAAAAQRDRHHAILEEIGRIQLKLKTDLTPALKASQSWNIKYVGTKLKSAGKLFAESIDEWQSARARLVYENALKLITMRGGPAKNSQASSELVFTQGGYSPEPLALRSPDAEIVAPPATANAAASTTAPAAVSVAEGGPAQPRVTKSSKKAAAMMNVVKPPVKPDYERSCKVLSIPLASSVPRETSVIIKKFEKVAESFNFDALTRTNAEVFLVSANATERAYSSKRHQSLNPIYHEKFIQFSTAKYPRYDKLVGELDVGASFRSPDQFSRIVNSSGMSRPHPNEARVLNANGTMLLVSDPVVGPFDLVGFTLYDSVSSQSWSVVLASSGDLPRFGHSPRAQKVQDASVSKKPTLISLNEADMIPFYKLCAGRLVWEATTKGMIHALVAISMEQLEKRQEELEEEVSSALERVEELEEELSSLGALSLESVAVTDVFASQVASGDDEALAAGESKSAAQLIAYSAPPLEQQAKKGTIQEIVPHTVDFYRDIGNGIKVFGIMIPADEAMEGIPIEVFSEDWLRVCRHYLGKGPTERRFTTSAFIWSSVGGANLQPSSNPRANRWIAEFDKSYGWKEGYERERTKKLVRLEKKMYGSDAPEYTSDVVLLLRYGSRDLLLIKQWMKDRFDEYAPIRELRRQKEGREREFRISNHAKFCGFVFDIARSFLRGIEAMFNERSSINSEGVDRHQHDSYAISYFGRLLLSRFLSLRLQADDDRTHPSLEAKVSSVRVLDEAFLIDTDNVHPFEDALLRFDVLPHDALLGDRDGILAWAPTVFVEDAAKNPLLNRPDLQPRVGQVVYALYKLHCFECKRPTNLCRFPGCRCIRQEAFAVMQQQHQHQHQPQQQQQEEQGQGQGGAAAELVIEEIGVTQAELKGTGAHPIEMAIRRYLLSGRELYNQLLPVLPSLQGGGLSPAEEVKVEQDIDDAEAERLRIIAYLRISWRDLELEGHQFRYLARRILRPELTAVLSPEDVMNARGGIKWTADEEAASPKVLEDAEQLVPRPASAAESSTVAKEEESRSETFSATGGLVEIPNALIFELLGGVGEDSVGNRVPLHLVDPYPGKGTSSGTGASDAMSSAGGVKIGSGSVERPMAKVMFDWLVAHLCVSRPKRVPAGSGDRGQHLSSAISIKLDRQLCNGTTFLLDGSLVVVQILYGVLQGSSLTPDELSGTPHGAIRFCPSKLFSALHQGLTIAVYDMRSGATLTTSLHGRGLARVAEAFDVPDTNTPLVARKVFENASLVVRLSRVGEVCTAVSVDINGIQRQTENSGRVESSSKEQGFRALGRREGRYDARKERLRLAKKVK